jgi:hypothetical protein
MTLYDLLFIALFLTALGTLIVAATSAFRGRRARALRTLRTLALGTVIYLGIVYIATALSKQVVLRVGDPECSDDWCITVERVERTPKNAVMVYNVTLRIFSRALRVASVKMLRGTSTWWTLIGKDMIPFSPHRRFH